MKLGEVMAMPDVAARDVEIHALAYDSRNVGPGTLFFCVVGLRQDGHDFAADAVARGAAALVVQRPLGLGVPELLVPSARAAMGPAAARLQQDPTAHLRVVGVTGTNGKTTTAYLLRALLEAGGETCGLLGTVKSVVGGHERPVKRTTPEAIELQAAFREMLSLGDRACAMEVSSHALELDRTLGIHFAAAIFTNLTQDHLDFHPTMEDYFLAKRRLFVADGQGLEGQPAAGPAKLAVINVDDPYGRRLADELPDAVTFGVQQPADYRARDVQMGFAGCRATIDTPSGSFQLSLPLPGRFNVLNALGAFATAHHLGSDLGTLLATLAHGVRVPGRFEPVDEGQDFAVLVDYAHTPDSLDNVLAAARELSGDGRVVCVFGAGGDRDSAKRPMMGEAAARNADILVVTSDNPRSEDPDAIIAQVMQGVEPSSSVHSLVDRREAIELAVELAQGGDVVVIAGKGHEQGQELAGGHVVPFDDATVAREALRARARLPA